VLGHLELVRVDTSTFFISAEHGNHVHVHNLFLQILVVLVHKFDWLEQV